MTVAMGDKSTLCRIEVGRDGGLGDCCAIGPALEGAVLLSGRGDAESDADAVADAEPESDRIS